MKQSSLASKVKGKEESQLLPLPLCKGRIKAKFKL